MWCRAYELILRKEHKRLGRFEWRPTRLLIEPFRSQVHPIRPNDSPCFVVDSDLSEISRVTEGFKNTGPLPGREIDVSDGAVVENETETVVAYDRHAHNSGWIGHNPILGQRCDRQEGLGPTSALPVG
jgi:hypothetical protein